MDFVAFAGLPLPVETDLNGALFAIHRGGEGQQSETGHALHIAFHLLRVEYLLAHHLESAADTDDGLAVVVSLKNGLCTTVAAQFHQVVDGAFRSGQDNDIGFLYLFSVVGVEKVYATVLFQHVEIGEVAQVAEHHDGDVHLTFMGFHTLPLQRNAVFFLDVDILEIGQHPQNGHAADTFQLAASFVEEAAVAPELIDNDALDALAVFRLLQHDGAKDGGKDAAAVDVCHENDISPCIAGHRHIHDIHVAEVDFGNTACTLHHDRMETGSQTVEGFMDSLPQDFAPFTAEILRGMLVADGAAVENHLRSVVAVGFQQQGVHIGMAGNACSFCLNGLCAAYLQSFGRGITVQGHILRLEGSWLVAVLQENAAEGRGYQALAYIAARSGKHQGVKSFHKSMIFLSPQYR